MLGLREFEGDGEGNLKTMIVSTMVSCMLFGYKVAQVPLFKALHNRTIVTSFVREEQSTAARHY